MFVAGSRFTSYIQEQLDYGNYVAVYICLSVTLGTMPDKSEIPWRLIFLPVKIDLNERDMRLRDYCAQSKV